MSTDLDLGEVPITKTKTARLMKQIVDAAETGEGDHVLRLMGDIDSDTIRDEAYDFAKGVVNDAFAKFGQHAYRVLLVSLTGAIEIRRLKHLAVFAAHKAKRVGLEKRIAQLEKDLADVKGFSYRGVWDEHSQYNADDFVTRHGSIFHCRRSTRSEPPGPDWQLAVKRGRDAR